MARPAINRRPCKALNTYLKPNMADLLEEVICDMRRALRMGDITEVEFLLDRLEPKDPLLGYAGLRQTIAFFPAEKTPIQFRGKMGRTA